MGGVKSAVAVGSGLNEIAVDVNTIEPPTKIPLR